MIIQKIYVDGMMSGTGLRNAIEGGYIYPEDIGISAELRSKIASWIESYRQAHFRSYDDVEEVRRLDKEGMEITLLVREELKDVDVSYYSDATLTHM